MLLGGAFLSAGIQRLPGADFFDAVSRIIAHFLAGLERHGKRMRKAWSRLYQIYLIGGQQARKILAAEMLDAGSRPASADGISIKPAAGRHIASVSCSQAGRVLRVV